MCNLHLDFSLPIHPGPLVALCTLDWSDGLLTSVSCCVPLYLLRSTLVLGVGVWLVSDASKKHGKGAYAWVIASEWDILCSNTGLVYAAVKSMTSYRAEAFGVLSLVTFLRRLFLAGECSFKTSLKIYCNNSSVVNSAGRASDTKADADVFLQLCQVLEEMKAFLSIKFVHVKGHETLTPFSSRETVLNHWCDKHAKAVVAKTPIGMCQQHFHFPVAKVAISCKGTVGRCLSSWLRSAVARTELLQYLQEKYEWDDSITALIAWDAYKAAHRRLPACQRIIMVKFRSWWLVTRARLSLPKSSPTNICPTVSSFVPHSGQMFVGLLLSKDSRTLVANHRDRNLTMVVL